MRQSGSRGFFSPILHNTADCTAPIGRGEERREFAGDQVEGSGQRIWGKLREAVGTFGRIKGMVRQGSFQRWRI